MVARKEIIVLSGGGHKGIVKISGVAGKTDVAKVSCSLDFRPNNAKLYIIGDNVAQMALNNTNCENELTFSAKSEIGCVLRSSSVTMFGGGGSKSEMLKKIEIANARVSQNVKQSNIDNKSVNIPIAEKTVRKDEVLNDIKIEDAQSSIECEIQNCEEQKVSVQEGEKSEQKVEPKSEPSKKQKQYVGVSTKADPLGEWTKYDGDNFYYAVKPQIDEMFVCYPEESLLASSVPNSKWVHVDAEDGYYVVGLLFDDDEPSFICYGVPQLKTDKVQAPAELENMCVWLPIDVSEDIVGYWIIYQSAHTGEIIK